MSDPRRTAANGRVADATLKGQVVAEAFVEGARAAVVTPMADVLRAPSGGLDRQLPHGVEVVVYERRDGWAFVQCADAYVGYVEEGALGAATKVSHRIGVLSSHLYPAPDIKTRPVMALPFGALVEVLDQSDDMAQTPEGYIPLVHLADTPAEDWVREAERFHGVPYLWGGDGPFGIDCSGLVQVSRQAAGLPAPRDSDMQEAEMGPPATDPLQRGDLIFWRGHVGIMLDGETLLHANAHHMAVTREPLTRVIARNLALGAGPVTSRIRPRP